MAKISIDGIEYDTDTMSDKAKAQLVSFQFCEVELRRLQQEFASIQTAGLSYAAALKEQLSRDSESIQETHSLSENLDNNKIQDEKRLSENTEQKKPGLFSGLFSKS